MGVEQPAVLVLVQAVRLCLGVCILRMKYVYPIVESILFRIGGKGRNVPKWDCYGCVVTPGCLWVSESVINSIIIIACIGAYLEFFFCIIRYNNACLYISNNNNKKKIGFPYGRVGS